MGPLSNRLKVALVQLAGSNVDKTANLLRAQRMVERAMTEQPETELVVLPEFFNAPYSTSTLHEYAEIIGKDHSGSVSPSYQCLSEIAKRWKITLVGGSIPEREPTTDKFYNTCLIFNPSGDLIGKHRKVHLFDIDIPNGITFRESDALTGGDSITTVDVNGKGNIGVGICYDLRFPELAMISARKHNVFAMIYPSAFNTVTGPMHWHLLARSRSLDNGIYTLLCSPARATVGYRAYGHSLVADPRGKVIAEAGEEEEIIYAELDPEEISSVRREIPVQSQRRFDVYPDVASTGGK